MNAVNQALARRAGMAPAEAPRPTSEHIAVLSSALTALAQTWPSLGVSDVSAGHFVDGPSPQALAQTLEGTVDPLAYQLIRSLLPALRSRQADHRDFVEQAMLALCAHLNGRFERREQPEAPKPVERVALSPWQERRAKELMTSQMDQGLSIAQVASECSLSRSHFSRAFKKNTGVSPRDWFLQVRLDKAKELLTGSDLTISQISLDCGFADQSHFTRVFTRMLGVTPFNWRRSAPPERIQRTG